MSTPNPVTPSESLEEKVRRLESQVRDLRDRDRFWPGSLFRRMLPSEVRRHLRASQRERLLAVRAFVDAAIERTEDAPPRPRRAEKLHIE